MKNLISKLGVSLVALALVVAPTLAIAQTAIEVAIQAPTSSNQVVVNEAYQFQGSATGGDGNYLFVWGWDDGSDDSGSLNNSGSTIGTHTFTETGNYNVSLTATDGTGAENSRGILINVVEEATGEALTISNIRVTDITETSAVVRWTTNEQSTSRVIYDTVSHAGAVDMDDAPNFGYASSTGTSDESTMVTEHSVTVSGLQSDTQYYFRVISTR